MCRSKDLAELFKTSARSRFKVLKPPSEVLKRIAKFGILSSKKYRLVPDGIKQLARISANRKRGKRAGKGGNRQRQKERRRLKIVQWNVNGWISAKDLLIEQEFENADVLLLAETWQTMRIEIDGYVTTCANAIKLNRLGRPSGGLVIAVKEGIKHEVMANGRYTQRILLSERGVNIINAYFPPTLTTGEKKEPFPVDEIFRLLLKELRMCGDSPVIIAGDLNCRLDGPFNAKGKDLCERMAEVGIRLAFEPNQPTFVGHSDGGSIVDIHLTNMQDRLLHQEMTDSKCSDHKKTTTVWSIRVCRNETSKSPLCRSVEVDKLKNCAPAIKEKANQMLLDTGVDECIDYVTKELLKFAVIKKRRKSKNYLTAKCIQLIQEYKRCIESTHVEELRRTVLNEIRKCKKEFFDAAEKKRMLLAEDKPWSMVRKKKMSNLPIACRAMAVLHLSKLLQFDAQVNLNARTVPIRSQKERGALARRITMSELNESILSGKDRKAAGSDGITHELMKESADFLSEVWLNAFNYCFLNATIPKSWKSAPTVFISKGKGDCESLDNYRNVVLQSVPYKILTKIIQRRLETVFDSALRSEQHGFRKCKGTNTAIASVVNELERVCKFNAKQKGKSLFIGFVDFQKAFDCLDRRLIAVKLKERFGIPGRLCRFVQAVLSENELFAVDGEWKSEKVVQKRGVMQGDCLSPYLFIMFVDDLICTLTSNAAIKVVMYADDLAIMTERKEELQASFDQLKKWCDDNGMKVNVRKTVVMKFARGGGASFTERNLFSYDGETISLVKEFCYLGMTLQPTLCLTKHVTKMKNACDAKTLMNAGRVSSWSIDAGVRIFEMIYMPKIRYGLEKLCFKLTLENLRTIDRIKHNFLRRLLVLPKNAKIQALYELTSEKRPVELLIEAKFEFDCEVIEKYVSEIESEKSLYVREGPAYECYSWRQALSADKRRAVVGSTVHGFHSLVCTKEKCFSINDCGCRLCKMPKIDKNHILLCKSIPANSLLARVKFLSIAS